MKNSVKDAHDSLEIPPLFHRLGQQANVIELLEVSEKSRFA